MEKFNINTATFDELLSIVHIGNARAAAIIEKREASPFKDIYELSALKGFGKKRIDDILTEGKLFC